MELTAMFDGTDASSEPVLRRPPQPLVTWTVLAGAVRTAWRRRRTRHAIAGLDRYLLKDIGVSYAEAEAEANKPFWVL
jgi:uncharacterized protein YjiS (DUF1127 family)